MTHALSVTAHNKLPVRQLPLVRIAFAIGILLLAFDPIVWLVQTWRDPAYDSKGFYIFGFCLALFAWSLSSPRVASADLDERPGHDGANVNANVNGNGNGNGNGIKNAHKLAFTLLALTAVIRLIGQVLAINMIGAAALIVDIYAIGLLLSLSQRRRALSPALLALSFAFSLPLERVVQRTIGYGLQHLSADGSCALLGSLFDDVVCHGIRIIIAGRDVLVDLPCSGARAILLLLLFYALSAALARPTGRQALGGLAITIIAAVLANILRVSVLAIGIARPDLAFGIDVMAQPYHDLIGLVLLGAACAPILLWAIRISEKRAIENQGTQPLNSQQNKPQSPLDQGNRVNHFQWVKRALWSTSRLATTGAKDAQRLSAKKQRAIGFPRLPCPHDPQPDCQQTNTAWTNRSWRQTKAYQHDAGIIPDRIRRDSCWLVPPPRAEQQFKRATVLRSVIQHIMVWRDYSRHDLPALAAAMIFMALAAVIISLPRHAIDVARRDIAIHLPVQLDGVAGEHEALSVKENAYFVQFGGAAARARYGDKVLLVVRTSAPLRHLHAPSDCLRGIGLKVDYLGARFEPFPTAIYKAMTADGSAYRIEVSFVSDQGFVTTNVSQAVWRWLQHPRSIWSAVQRITPWDMPAQKRNQFDRSVAAYFDLACTDCPDRANRTGRKVVAAKYNASGPTLSDQ